jgi:hypothetical protein
VVGLEPGHGSSLASACLFWYQLIMSKSTISGISKKKRGRPALYEGSEGKGAPQIGLRLPPPELAAVDSWIAKQSKPKPSRPVAIRRLVEIGLKTEEPSKLVRKPARSARAAELAAAQIEKMIDPAASADERDQRRRRLTKGPPEFREDRVDLPKAKPTR